MNVIRAYAKFNFDDEKKTLLAILRKIGNGLAFVGVGIVTITVGFFMLRGTMRMWDRKNSSKKNSENS